MLYLDRDFVEEYARERDSREALSEPTCTTKLRNL